MRGGRAPRSADCGLEGQCAFSISHATAHACAFITSAVPGSAQGLYLVVSDIEAARAELVDPVST